MAEHNFVGKIGEDLAREYLEKNGYKILEQNYKTKYAEIDLVASAPGGLLFGKKTLVFVEVRTKVGENFGSPEDTLNKAKLRKVLWNAKTYSAFKNWQGPARIDAICIVLKPLGHSPLGRSPTGEPTGEADFSILRLTHHENIVS